MKNFGKYLLLLLAILSIGGGSTYGSSLAEIRQEQPYSSEDLKAAGPVLLAFRKNPFQEVPDLSEKQFPGSISPIPVSAENIGNSDALTLFTFLKRDLRLTLFQLIFPQHFFL